MSENISTATSLNGESVTRQPLIKSMRVVKKETLKLISCWVDRSNDANMVLENFIPPLLDAVLLDYQRCTVPSAREPEVLSTMATTVNKLKGTITTEIPKIFDALFECTLDMINKVNWQESIIGGQIILGYNIICRACILLIYTYYYDHCFLSFRTSRSFLNIVPIFSCFFKQLTCIALLLFSQFLLHNLSLY